MKNQHGVTMRKRRNRSGSISWQIDYGVVDGKRIRQSFATLEEARKANLGLFKSRNAGLVEIDREKQRLRALVAEQSKKLGELEREIVRMRAYRAGAVCPSELRDHPHVFELPHATSGVYFLCDEVSRILYVGMSQDIPARVARHRQRGVIPFSVVFVIPYAPHECFEMESWWIKKLQPPHNGEAPIQFQTGHCRP
jgi:hypothetical protein